ncbi:hypothetical protein R8Z50_12300 [Longispora sp. K20-0274]|uniref:hypothetical protein n=1 Tax=Longispora sp. K20-0274 TaxID=3088255 RepID=UPI0039995DD2
MTHRTEDDLRAVFHADEPHQIEPGPVLGAVRRGIVVRRRRRLATAAFGAVFAVMAAALAPVLLRDPAPVPPPAGPSPRPALSMTVREGDVNGQRLEVAFLSKNVQAFHVTSISPAFTGIVSVYERGFPLIQRWRPVPGSQPVTVGTRPAHYASPGPDAKFPALVWEYAPGAWAGLEAGADSATAPVPEIALRLAFGPPVDTRVPVRVDGLPAGYEMAGVHWNTVGPPEISYRDAPSGSPGANTWWLQVRPSALAVFPPEAESFTVAGHRSTWTSASLQYVDMGTCALVFKGLPERNPPFLEAFVRTITMPADCTDQGTWFSPARTSVAGGT